MPSAKYIVNWHPRATSKGHLFRWITGTAVFFLLVLFIVYLCTTWMPSSTSSLTATTSEETLSYRRDFLRNMTRDAWTATRKQNRNRRALTGETSFSGQMAIAAASTLKIMNLDEEFMEAKELVEHEKFDFSAGTQSVRVSGIVSQYLTGLLSAFALDEHDQMWVEKARQIAQFLRPAYKSNFDESATPYCYLDPATKEAHSAPFPSEVFTQFPPYLYLANITSNQFYYELVVSLQNTFRKIELQSGLLKPEKIKIDTEKGRIEDDSVPEIATKYETNLYASLLNVHRQTRSELALGWFEKVIDRVVVKQIKEPQPGTVYVTSFFDSDSTNSTMHLYHCNLGWILALGSRALKQDLGSNSDDPKVNAFQTKRYAEYFRLGELIVEMCHQVAENSSSTIPDQGAQLAEAYFILHRLTGNEKYRTYAWELTKALHQQNFTTFPANYFSATLKYLYLTQSNDLLPLEQWIFTESGHPLPIIGPVEWEEEDDLWEVMERRRTLGRVQSPSAN